jgi:16S rRNA (cytidine1402-2'-O)-methyltransferase
MHSTSAISDTDPPKGSGTLYVVSTPIGNREDITLRALSVLQDADWVAAEDTRHTGRMLKSHGIRTRLISYHEHNEKKRTPELIQKLLSGTSVALLSNAGTPSVSDPGFRLIQQAAASGLRIVPIPGVSAAITALSVSGLPTDSFVFIGFLPPKGRRRLAEIQALAAEPRTLIFYESPRRICRLLEELVSIFGDRHSVLAREMTKVHEEFLRGPLSKLHQELRSRPSLKGEFTLLVSRSPDLPDTDLTSVRPALRSLLKQTKKPLSAAVKDFAIQHGLPRKSIYEEALRIKEETKRERKTSHG